MGSNTYQNEAKSMHSDAMHSDAMPSWVQSLFFGGLNEPSSSWQKDLERLENWFNKFTKKTSNSIKTSEQNHTFSL